MVTPRGTRRRSNAAISGRKIIIRKNASSTGAMIDDVDFIAAKTITLPATVRITVEIGVEDRWVVA
jgi:hypothetical protein